MTYNFEDFIALAESRGFKGAQIGLEAFWLWLENENENENASDEE